MLIFEFKVLPLHSCLSLLMKLFQVHALSLKNNNLQINLPAVTNLQSIALLQDFLLARRKKGSIGFVIQIAYEGIRTILLITHSFIDKCINI